MDMCICGLAIKSERYLKSILIMQQSLIEHGYKGVFLTYVTVLPKNCPSHPYPNHRYIKGTECVPYAFKAYMMKAVEFLGFRYVGYLDSVIVLQQDFAQVRNVIKQYGYFFGHNTSDLGLYTSDACLKHFGKDRQDVLGKPCIHGGIMFLDLHKEICREFLQQMYILAYDGGPYCADWRNDKGQVSKDSRVIGHRPHQSVATLLAMKLGMTHFIPNSLTYENDKDCIFRV